MNNRAEIKINIVLKLAVVWRAALLLFGCQLFVPACAADLRVHLLLSGNATPYQAFSNTFQKNLASPLQLNISESTGEIGRDDTDIIVAVGMKAAEAAMQQSSAPVLVVMVPQNSYEALLASLSGTKKLPPTSVIYLNQPWERQADFLFALLPERRKIGVLYSAPMRKELPRLNDDVRSHGGTLVAQEVESDATLFADLEKILRDSNVLLAVPDNDIYSSSHVRNILLSTYKANIPLVGISQGYVNAGAVAAIFSTPEQLAEQSATTVSAFAKTLRWMPPQYPNNFSIAVNQQVARSLGIELASEAELRARMKKIRRENHD